MKVRVIASGSRGNCTLLEGEKRILLDAGIAYSRIQSATGYKNADIALITHEHRDHALKTTINQLMRRGVEVVMTTGTKLAMGLKDSAFLHYDCAPFTYDFDGVRIESYKVVHDAAEPVCFVIKSDETILYAVDLNEMPEFGISFDKVIIEGNYIERILAESGTDSVQKERIKKAHLSVEKLARWISGKVTKEIHVVHVSNRHAYESAIRQILKEKVGETALYVY